MTIQYITVCNCTWLTPPFKSITLSSLSLLLLIALEREIISRVCNPSWSGDGLEKAKARSKPSPSSCPPSYHHHQYQQKKYNTNCIIPGSYQLLISTIDNIITVQ